MGVENCKKIGAQIGLLEYGLSSLEGHFNELCSVMYKKLNHGMMGTFATFPIYFVFQLLTIFKVIVCIP